MNNTAQSDLPFLGGKENHADRHQSSPSTLTPSPAKGTFDKFMLFPKLPLELRFKIWRHTFPDPRIVFLQPVRRGGRRSKFHDELDVEDFQMFPTALYVNRESREETLKTYHMFCSPDEPLAILCFVPMRDHLSISFIVLWLLSHDLRIELLEIESQKAYLKSVKNLNIWDVAWRPGNRVMFDEIELPHEMDGNCCGIRSVQLFANLEELSICFGESSYDEEYDQKTAM